MADGEDEGGGGLRLDTAELKKFLKLGRSRPMTFAFCPAGGQEEPLFAAHRRKKPEVLGKSARKEAEQTKFACGTFSVDGKTMVLTCEKVIPGMAQKLKKMFRQQKVPLEVKLMGADGQEIS